MNTEVLSKLENKYKVNRPEISIGDTVVVDTVIRDRDKKRIQKFQGIVIAKKGKGLTRSFTVRKISEGIGVEKIFPLYSPNISKIKVLKHAKVRRAKLYYMRDRIGKRATDLKKGKDFDSSINELPEVKAEAPVEAAEVTPEVAEVEQVTTPEVPPAA